MKLGQLKITYETVIITMCYSSETPTLATKKVYIKFIYGALVPEKSYF